MPAAMALALAPPLSWVWVSVTAVSGATLSPFAARAGMVMAASSRASRKGISSFFRGFFGKIPPFFLRFFGLYWGAQAAAFLVALAFFAFLGAGSETSP